MFSDFESRGSGLEDGHLRRPERLDRLTVVMALALFWVVSTGTRDAVQGAAPDEQSPGPTTPQPSAVHMLDEHNSGSARARTVRIPAASPSDASSAAEPLSGGAGEGNRTLDIQLGKLSFYH